jgi:hypothetical protein
MISLGIDLVAGRNRVPMPATGKIALVTFLILICPTLALPIFLGQITLYMETINRNSDANRATM